MRGALALGGLLTLLAGAVWADCGAVAGACTLADGSYHAKLPDEADRLKGLVVLLHGAGGSGEAILRNRNAVQPILDRGYAVVAPDGSRAFGNGNGRVWNFLPGRPGRDEMAFLRDVARDASERFDIVTSRPLLAGFSAGGFMVSYLACTTPSAFFAYAPLAGGFWEPLPKDCAGPVRLFQAHGWRDTVVPLEGRPLRGGAFIQGDIFAGLDVWRRANGCLSDAPSGYEQTGDFLRRRWECGAGGALELALFPGGHQVPEGWADMVLDWIEGLPGE